MNLNIFVLWFLPIIWCLPSLPPHTFEKRVLQSKKSVHYEDIALVTIPSPLRKCLSLPSTGRMSSRNAGRRGIESPLLVMVVKRQVASSEPIRKYQVSSSREQVESSK